jgi:hypothetical protein
LHMCMVVVVVYLIQTLREVRGEGLIDVHRVLVPDKTSCVLLQGAVAMLCDAFPALCDAVRGGAYALLSLS